MMMQTRSSKGRGAGARASILTLLLVVCLVESASGSGCINYGHSCWGAHGKRSSHPPLSAPDWYLTRMLRRISSDPELAQPRQLPEKNDNLNTIFQVISDDAPDASAEKQLMPANVEFQVAPEASGIRRTMDAKPMLDDEILSKIKMWQILREAAEDN